MFVSLVKWIVRVIFVTQWHATFRGRRHIPPSGGLLLVCNHQSFLDIPLLGIAARRPVTFVARSTLLSHRLYRLVSRPFPVVHIDRERGDVDAMKRVINHLKQGRAIAVFPEGTRTRTGKLGPIKMGFYVMARRAGVPILPARIEGAFRIWPRHRRMPRNGTLRLTFGKPIAVDTVSAKSLERSLTEFWLR